MTETARQTAQDALTALVGEVLDGIARRNQDAIDAAAAACLATIGHHGLIHVAGSGHGLGLVLETFYRAGGLACIKPMWEADLLPLAGARSSTARERTPGVGTALVDRADVRSGEVVVVFSQSGVNPVPVEIARRSRALGATVIAVTSEAAAAAAAHRSAGASRLVDEADVVIDTGVPAGDASFDVTPGVRTAALSTIAGAHAWNLVLVALHERAAGEGVELPTWISSNVPGGDARIDELVRTYGPRVPAL